jgi:hypothetical protein
MIQEITYSEKDLTDGKCTSCGEQSSEILIGTSECIDCIEANKFEELTTRAYYVESQLFNPH